MSVEVGRLGGDGALVVRCDGELDVVAVVDLGLGLPLPPGCRSLVLDLTAVTFFDSGGVRLVDRLSRTSAEHGAAFRVVAPPGTPARRVLDLVGLAGPLVDDGPATGTAQDST